MPRSRRGTSTVTDDGMAPVAEDEFDPIREAQRQWDDRWDVGLEAASAMSVMRLQQLLLARLDAIAGKHGLTFARFEALALLHFSRAGTLPLGKIGERLMIHPASVTNIINRLEADELVQRHPHPTDGRAVLAKITPTGTALAEKIERTLAANGLGMVGLTADELRQLIDLVTRFRAHAGDPIGVPPQDE